MVWLRERFVVVMLFVIGLLVVPSLALAETVLGPELVTNGTFDSNISGWYTNTYYGSYDGGNGSPTAQGGSGPGSADTGRDFPSYGGYISQYITVEPNRDYQLSMWTKGRAWISKSVEVINVVPWTLLWEGGAGGSEWSKVTVIFNSNTATQIYLKIARYDTYDWVGIKVDDVSVRLVNVRPSANAGADIIATTTDTIVLDGSGSSDPGGTVVGYAWDLDEDGVADVTGVHPDVTSQIGGKLKVDVINNVSLTVTDNDGATSSDAVLVTVVDAIGLITKIANLEGQLAAIEANLESKGYNVLDPETSATINAAIDSLYSDLNNAKILLSEIYAAVGTGTNALNVVVKIGQLNADLAAAQAQIVTLTAQVTSAIQGLGKIRTLIATPFGQRSNPGYVSNLGDTVVAPVVNQIIDDLLTPFGQINNQRK